MYSLLSHWRAEYIWEIHSNENCLYAVMARGIVFGGLVSRLCWDCFGTERTCHLSSSYTKHAKQISNSSVEDAWVLVSHFQFFSSCCFVSWNEGQIWWVCWDKAASRQTCAKMRAWPWTLTIALFPSFARERYFPYIGVNFSSSCVVATCFSASYKHSTA